MIKEALQYLNSLGKPEVLSINGHSYSKDNLNLIRLPMVATLKVDTLSGLTEYILSKFDELSHNGNMVHVVSYCQVDLLSKLFFDGQRGRYMTAEAFSPQFNFGQWYDLENFIIALQACFVRNGDAESILKVVGNIKDSAVRQYGDDGITQQVTAKTGLANVEDVKVPNPVMLAPFRTFLEIDQPESEFVFRMRQGNNGPSCALFEADGGAWKLEAMAKIKAYLEEGLAETEITVIS